MSDTGGGHRSAAEAVSAGLRRVHGDRFQVTIVDALADHLPPLLNRVGDLYGPLIHRAPWLWGGVFHLSDSPRRVSAVTSLFYPHIKTRFKALIEQVRPNLIISVHPFMNHVPARILEEECDSIPLVTLITDPVTVHAAWVCPRVDLCLAANSEAARSAVALGMAAEKIKVTGLPVDPHFGDLVHSSVTVLRKKWRLPSDRPLALVMGGREGAGRLYELVSALDRARVPAALAVVAGRNQVLRRRLEMRSWEMPVFVLGLINKMPELMGASDLILTKAGPATLWEAMAAGLPIIMTDYVPGQETGNVAFIQRAGAGRLVKDPRKVADLLLNWLRPGDDTLARMASNSRALARPQAALEIADLLASLVR